MDQYSGVLACDWLSGVSIVTLTLSPQGAGSRPGVWPPSDLLCGLDLHWVKLLHLLSIHNLAFQQLQLHTAPAGGAVSIINMFIHRQCCHQSIMFLSFIHLCLSPPSSFCRCSSQLEAACVSCYCGGAAGGGAYIWGAGLHVCGGGASCGVSALQLRSMWRYQSTISSSLTSPSCVCVSPQ